MTRDIDLFERVAARFNMPSRAVEEIAMLDPKVLVQRYLDEESTPSNTTTPSDAKTWPPGSVRVAPYGGDLDNRYIDYVRVFNPDELVNAEAEQGIKQHPSYALYRQWALEGRQPPYISVYETDKGRLQSTNRRRTLVAQELNRPITGWFGPLNKETGLSLKLGDIKRALREEIDLARSREAAAACGSLTDISNRQAARR